MVLDNYPFLDYLPIGALDGATEVGPSLKNSPEFLDPENEKGRIIWRFCNLKRSALLLPCYSGSKNLRSFIIFGNLGIL